MGVRALVVRNVRSCGVRTAVESQCDGMVLAPPRKRVKTVVNGLCNTKTGLALINVRSGATRMQLV